MGDKNSTAVAVEETAIEKELAKQQAEAVKENQSRSGKGTRVSVSQTRGKGTRVISYEEFDKELPDTLPTSIAEFAQLTGTGNDEAKVVSFLIDGYNVQSLSLASDPVAEYVNPAWGKETITQFKLAVRNYAKATNTSIEDAVSIIKPGIEKAFAAASAK